MPLFRLPNAKLIYFAHVPKCAGTTIEHYLELRFGPAAFLDQAFNAPENTQKWSVTSPQHMPESVRLRYLPDSFLDARFATVRHPATRLRSVFLFQREIEGRIPPEQSFESWLRRVRDTLDRTPEALDGHLRPMTDYVPEDAAVFRIEAGLAPLVAWIDAQSGTTAPDVAMPPMNNLVTRLQFEERPVPEVVLSEAAMEQVAQLYPSDYARFDYGIRPDEGNEAP